MVLQRAGTRITLKTGKNSDWGRRRRSQTEHPLLPKPQRRGWHCCATNSGETHCPSAGGCRRKARGREGRGAAGNLSVDSARKKDRERLLVSGSQISAQTPWKRYSDRVSYIKNEGNGVPEKSIEKPHVNVKGPWWIILTSKAKSISGEQIEKSGTRDVS